MRGYRYQGNNHLSNADQMRRMSGTKIFARVGQSNETGFAFVANQISVPDLCFAYPNVKQVDHLATINGDPLVWTFDRPVPLTSFPLPDPTTITPVSLSPRTGDSNGDSGTELSLMRRLDRAWPGRWALGRMSIPSSSMLNWETNADGSTYPTIPPANQHLIDQWFSFLTFLEGVFNGKIFAVLEHQGESDAQTSPLSTAFKSRKINFINATRTYLQNPNLPWFITKLHTGSPGSFNANVRTDQDDIGNNTGGTTPRVKTISVDSVSVSTLHYTADQYAKAGVVQAQAVLPFLGINDPPEASFTWSWSGTNVTFDSSLSIANTGSITKYAWNFGDGSPVDNTASPSHNYGALGTYTVTLTVTDTAGAINTISRLVTCAAGTWPIDAKGGFAMPTTLTHWQALHTAAGISGTVANPDSAHRPGAVSATPIPDDIGAFPLTVAGGTVQFQTDVPNVSAKAMRTINNVTDGASTTDAALPDVGTTSCAIAGIACIWTVPTSGRGLFSMGTTETSITFSNANPPKLVVRSNTQNTTGTANIDNKPHFYFLRHNRTNSTCKMLSDLESITVTFAPSVTGKRTRIGLTALPSPGAQFLLEFRFDGAHAELTDNQVKALALVMGWFIA